MSRASWLLVVLVVTAMAFAGGFVAMRELSRESSSDDVTVNHVTLLRGEIVLTLESHSNRVVAIAQAIVNDAYVDFEAGTPHAADIAIDYPWIEGQSYEIELLTSTGASIDYEIDDAKRA